MVKQEQQAEPAAEAEGSGNPSHGRGLSEPARNILMFTVAHVGADVPSSALATQRRQTAGEGSVTAGTARLPGALRGQRQPSSGATWRSTLSMTCTL